MKKLTLLCFTALLLGGLVAGCSKSDPEDTTKVGEVKTVGGQPLPADAANAKTPLNPFEAAGVGGPGSMKGKKGGGGAPPGGAPSGVAPAVGQ